MQYGCWSFKMHAKYRTEILQITSHWYIYIYIYIMHAYIYIYIYIHTHTHTHIHTHAHVTLHPVAMLRISEATTPSPYAFTACTGTILVTDTENFFPRD